MNCKTWILNLPSRRTLLMSAESMYGWASNAYVDWLCARPMEEHKGTWCSSNSYSWRVSCSHDGKHRELHSISWDWGEVIHIPAWCTYLCQPVDVGINKSIKTAMKGKWEDWMLDGDGLVNGVAKEPSRKMVAEWLFDVYKNIPGQTARTAWMKKGYKWF